MIRTKKTKGRKAFLLTVLILVLLILFSHRNPETSRLPSNVLNMAVSPVNRLFYSASRSLQDLYDHVFGKKATQAEVDRLTLENQALKDEVRTLKGVVGDAPYLKDEYAMQHVAGHALISAEITMSDPSPTFVRFTINKGSKDGVSKGDIVVQGVKNADQSVVSGLIGQVTEVGFNYSKVSTILDQSHNISILFPSSKKYGVINNRDAERFYGYLLDAQTDVPVGEEIVTSGVPRPTLIPSVTLPRKETTPATVATATDSSPWAASTCPLVLMTCWKGAGVIAFTFTPAALAFAFGRMISSLCSPAGSLVAALP